MRKSIKANEGYVLTNGEVYGTEIFLADGIDADGFWEITKEEYENIFSDEDVFDEERATEEDYKVALRHMGVSV